VLYIIWQKMIVANTNSDAWLIHDLDGVSRI